MEQYANILFEHEVSDNKSLKEYVERSSGDMTTIFTDGVLQIVIKEVKEDKQTLEKVRMIAGTISKQLKKLKVSTGNIDEVTLRHAFSLLNKNDLIIAFVEGWHLGAYAFDPYKSKKSPSVPTLTF